ncbi:hypothetical protein S245_053582, partial [Arachis hypogaea]
VIFVLKCECDKEESIEILLITMYAKVIDLASARRIFDLIIKKEHFLMDINDCRICPFGSPIGVLDFTINNNDASVFWDGQHCSIMKTSLDYLSSLSTNDGLSGAMRALIFETST